MVGEDGGTTVDAKDETSLMSVTESGGVGSIVQIAIAFHVLFAGHAAMVQQHEGGDAQQGESTHLIPAPLVPRPVELWNSVCVRQSRVP